MRRIAIIGSGISGLAVAHRLAPHARVTLFEAGGHFGGHANTVDVTLPGPNGPVTHGVDTGFLVFNHRTYPHLLKLFAELEVETAKSDMSFSVQVPAIDLEWAGTDLDAVFAQRRNLAKPAFWGMLRDILRFNRLTTALAVSGEDSRLAEPIDRFLDRNGFGAAFRDWYFLPMLGCIWSCPTDQMLKFPVATMIRFCHNHGLIQVTDRPQWYTVRGGSRNYVRRIIERLDDARLNTPVRRVERLPQGDGRAGVLVTTDSGSERFDEVVLACHSDQSLALLGDATPRERAVLGAIRYHDNVAVLHTDVSLLPRQRKAWAAWNYERSIDAGREHAAVCLHYLIDRLQPLPFTEPVVVTLNPARIPRPDRVIAEFEYAHPVFDQAAIEAQRALPELQGRQHTWFCGAWAGYGFHEDGLKSGLAVAEALQRSLSITPAMAEAA